MVRNIKQGDYLSKIAHANGHYEPTIWNHPENAQLVRKRKNPQILLPGDRMHVPEKARRNEQGQTEQRHRFVCRHLPLHLRIEPLRADYRKEDDPRISMRVDADIAQNTGTVMDLRIPKTANQGEVKLSDDRRLRVQIGHLDPVVELSGVKGRLNNLGYRAGPPASPELDAQFMSALEEFQCDQGLSVDGICGPNTQAKLEQVHGC